LRALDEREPEDRLATLPDFFVEEVRLDAAAARFGVDFDALRDFEAEPLEAVLFEPDFTAPRLELRDADFLAVERAEPERAEVERDEDFLAADEVDLAEVFLAVVFLAVVFLAAALLPPDFEEDLLEDDLAADLAEVFLGAVFLAVVFFAPDLAEDFAVDLVVDFAAVFVPDFLAAVLFWPDFAAPERDDEPVDFAAVLVPDFLAPDLAEDFAELEEPLRELLFFAVFLVLVAPVSPVNNCVSGFDLMSIGIKASFKSLRVQPSRLQGNVVIPTGFRISESVDSRVRTFSVDTLLESSLCTCSLET
jgi:hypothetical protein